MSNKIIHQGNLIALHKERVELDDERYTYFDIVKHPGGAVIAAINSNKEICMLKQWRHAVQEHIWELPAGCLEANETPLNTAIRELEEEAGVKANVWRELGRIIPSPGFSNEVLYLFAATELSPGRVNLDDAEKLEAHWLPFDKAMSMARDGTIEDAKTLALLLRL